MLKKFVIVIL